MRLLNAEGKALELHCEILDVLDTDSGGLASCLSDPELRRLDLARHMLRTQFNPVPRRCSTTDSSAACGIRSTF